MSKLPREINEDPRWGICCCFDHDKYQIFTYDHDRNRTPHFHVVDTKTYGKNFHCRILINKPRYYKGETTKLSNYSIKELCKSLDIVNSGNGIISPFSNWFQIVNDWNSENNKQVKIKKRPDYTKLNGD